MSQERDPARSQRESLEALELIGLPRFAAFVRAAARRPEAPSSLAHMLARVEAGDDLAGLFAQSAANGPRRVDGFYLRARQAGPRRYVIALGFVALGRAGDGGEWAASFDEQGTVTHLSEAVLWLHR